MTSPFAVRINDGSVLIPGSTGRAYRAHDIMVGRCVFADLADVHHGCGDHIFDDAVFNVIHPLRATQLHKPLAFHSGSSTADTRRSSAIVGNSGDDSCTDSKLAANEAPQMYGTPGLYLQGPRRYWRRFMDE